MIVTCIYLPFWCHILLSLLYMIAVSGLYCILMSMCKEEVVTSKCGRILNFRPIGFLVSILQVQTLSYSPMSGILYKKQGELCHSLLNWYR